MKQMRVAAIGAFRRSTLAGAPSSLVLRLTHGFHAAFADLRVEDASERLSARRVPKSRAWIAAAACSLDASPLAEICLGEHPTPIRVLRPRAGTIAAGRGAGSATAKTS